MYPRFIKLVSVIGLAFLPSCAVPTEFQTSRMPTTNETFLSNELFREVNEYRHDRGKQALTRHAGLAALARTHAQYLRGHREKGRIHSEDANHYGFASRSGKARYSMGFTKVAENVVVCRCGKVSSYVSLWSQSPKHRKTMIEAYEYTGIGTVVDGDGAAFSVQLFATKTGYDSRTSSKDSEL